MTIDLADFVDGTPGRFVPQEMQGQLVEAEHLVRYRWAAALAPGRRVLDAGCGLGYGSRILAQAGAASVAAIDIAPEIVEVAATEAGESVSCQVGDVRELPFADGSFDVVVCFEVIEHIEGQDRALDEVRRVLAPGGILAVSSPNRDAYVPGNPHHVRELLPDELERLLAARWSRIRLFRQHNFVASSVLSDDAAATSDGEDLEVVRVQKLHAKRPGEELYSIGLATDGQLPEARSAVMLSDSIEVRQWLTHFEAQQDILHRQKDALVEAQRTSADRLELLTRLAEAETRLAEDTALHAVADDVEATRSKLTEQLFQERRRADRADRVARDLQSSLSWRITRPLRLLKHLGRSR